MARRVGACPPVVNRVPFQYVDPSTQSQYLIPSSRNLRAVGVHLSGRRHSARRLPLACTGADNMVALWPALRSALTLGTSTKTLSVLTYNVFTGPPTPTALCGALEGSERLRLQAEQIKALKPDVVCLQEVQSDGVRETFERMLPEYAATYTLTVRACGQAISAVHTCN